MTDFKWKEELKAFVDGKTIQVKQYPRDIWRNNNNDLRNTFHLMISSSYEWRVKPEPWIFRYKRYLWKEGERCSIHTFNEGGFIPDAYTGFIKWLDDDWQEMEVEVE